MGGKEGARGFLYQAFAAVLEALSQENWDKIYVEFDSNDDKVDIALEENGAIFKSIQVKSTINTFSKASLKKWLEDLIHDDVGATEFKLFLIGQCDSDAVTFINSISKLQRNKLDDKAKNSLKGFDTSMIQGRKVGFTCIPFDVEVLEKIVIASLFQYISCNKYRMKYDKISFITSVIVNDQMLSSIHGNGMDRKTFNKKLQKIIQEGAEKYEAKRIAVVIKSFSCKELEDTTKYLSLMDKFDGRNIKDGYDWNDDIYENVKKFLEVNLTPKYAYRIFLETHMSIAFAVGRVLFSKSGINVFPMQKTAIDGTVLWDVKKISNKKYSNWDVSHEMVNKNKYDSALILNVTHNIYRDVKQYIKENNLPIGRIINCKMQKVGATNFSIEDGNHAWILANSIYDVIKEGTIKHARLHIFASTPNGFMFFLGQISLGFGKCILYEYDFEQRNSCSYLPSIRFTD